MNVTREQINKITDMAKDNFRKIPIQAYWSYSQEIEYEDRIAISWINAISTELKLDLKIKYNKERNLA